MTGWYVGSMILIALAFGVVLWRFLAPGREDALERDAQLPLEDVGESDLDPSRRPSGRDGPSGP